MHRVQLFDGTNYPTWKYRMEVVLEEYDLLEFITTEVGEREELVVRAEDTPEMKAQKKNPVNTANIAEALFLRNDNVPISHFFT